MPDMGDLDFSKLGGGLGDTPGMGGATEDDASDDDDEDMPDLTTAEEATHVSGAEESGKGKEGVSS
jgi:hypothetical protein